MGSWELISLEEAQRLATECMRGLPRKTETVDLRAALGRISAADIISREDNPPFDRSTMDGFALRSIDTADASTATPVNLDVTGEVRMGRLAELKLGKKQAVRIPTGGMLPEGADAVVMQEHTLRATDGTLQVLKPVAPGENVIRRGDDMVAGSVVVRSGCRIGVPDIGVLASCGVDRVTVVKKPIVTVVTTGDEIVSPDAALNPGQIRDVNSFTLSALAESTGCEAHLTPKVPDSQDGLLEVLKAAVRESDVVLISGGSSVGDRDFTTTAVQALANAKILFHGVAIKPGKPVLMALVGETAVFGIPGHTVAAMTVFGEIIAPALLARQGVTGVSPRFIIKAKLAASLRPDAVRDEIFRVRLERREDGATAWPLPAQSGLITVMTRAHGMVYTKAGQQEMQAGEIVEVQVLMDRVSGYWQGEPR